LTDAVAAEVSRATGAEATELAAREAGDLAIRASVNALVATYASTGPALTHTLAHGLNTNFVTVAIWVQHTDGLYYNDIVPLTQTDANTVVATLAVAANVKMVATSAAAI